MDERIKAYDVKMTKSYNNLLEEFGAIRAGRANPHVLDRITVEYYGTPTPLQQVGNVTVPEPRMIQIQPWEASLVKEIEKAIMMSDLGINPSDDGRVIRPWHQSEYRRKSDPSGIPGTDRGTKKRSGKRSEEKRRVCKSCCPQYQT